MRVFGRDLIRGGHYGQRSCEPHLKAEHMAAPTNPAKREKRPCQLGAVHTCSRPLWSPVLLIPALSGQRVTSRLGSGWFRSSTQAEERSGSAVSVNRVIAIYAA